MLNLICILHMRFLLQYLYMTVILSCFQINLSIWINLNDAFHADCIHLDVNKYVFMFQIYKESLQLYVFGLSSIIKDSRTLQFLKIWAFLFPRIPNYSGGCRNRPTLDRVKCGIARKLLRVSYNTTELWGESYLILLLHSDFLTPFWRTMF